MTPKEEAAYLRGEKAAFRRLLGVALQGLDREPVPDSPEAMQRRIAQLEAQRADSVAAARRLCAAFGDNEWEDGDHLGDVLDKHLGKHLHARVARPL